jgi:hypothetical protein
VWLQILHHRTLIVNLTVQTSLVLCVADVSPAMFKSFAACKLENSSNEFGDDSLALWGAVTVRARLLWNSCDLSRPRPGGRY